jgi:imidazolonepropionase-like amidohydrolase
MVHYGGATEDEALKTVTLNAAWIIGVDDRVGSIDVGKDADLVLWSADPLSNYARAEKVYIDGDLYFDIATPGLGTPHFSGVMHGDGGFGGDDADKGGEL